MKKLIFLMLLSVGAYGQTVHRVTNGMNLQTVIDNAGNGDVVLLEGGVYGNIIINKSLSIFGTGYFLNGMNSNSNLQATPASSFVGNIEFTSNAPTSRITGLQANDVIINSYQTQISKCRLGSISIKKSNVLVKQSYFSNFTIDDNLGSIQINNNLIEGTGSAGIANVVSMFNNTFLAPKSSLRDVSGNLGSYKNNIFSSVIDNGTGSNYWSSPIFNVTSNVNNQIEFNILGVQQYINISSSAPGISPISGLSLSNKISQDYTNMFLSGTTEMSLDARYQLAPNSPARGAGENGTDCGAFGGDDPYVLSGIPDIPSIYQLTVPSQVPQNGTLNVQIKAKTNN